VRSLLAILFLALAAASPALADGVGLVVRDDGTRAPVRVGGPDGVLTSDSTRLRGLVTEDDHARGDFRVEPSDDPGAEVRRLEDRIERNDRIRLPLTILICLAVGVLALVRPRAAIRALLLALALNLWLAWWLAAPAALAVVLLPLGWACAAAIAAYLVAMGLGAETVALSPLGPSQVGRFYGINNLLETMLLVAALVGVATLRRWGLGVAALAVVTVAGNRLGADGGGLLVLLTGVLVLRVRQRGLALTPRRVAVLAALVVAGGLLLVGLDAAAGGSSHVTDAVGGGPGGLVGDLVERVEKSVSRTFESPGAALVVLVSLAALVAVAVRGPRTPLLEALLAALAVSLLVNDTPSDVLAVGAVAALTLARLDVTVTATSRSRPR
jgi:hypothetical protein